jgi:hypothetical protein
VRRIRWLLFAEALTPSATVDVDAVQREIAEAEFQLGKPNEAQERAHKLTQLAAAKVTLSEMIEGRSSTRAVLWPEDEPE